MGAILGTEKLQIDQPVQIGGPDILPDEAAAVPIDGDLTVAHPEVGVAEGFELHGQAGKVGACCYHDRICP